MGLFKSIGGMFNDLTGATSAAQMNNKYQKEFAQNAHQWEVQDLKKAGLNPILSAGGEGATASGGGAASAGGGLSDIANSAVSLTQTLNDIQRVENETDLKEAETDLKKAETANANAENPYISPKRKAEIANIGSSTALNSAKTVSEKGTVSNVIGDIRKSSTNSAKRHREKNTEWKKGPLGLFNYRSTN